MRPIDPALLRLARPVRGLLVLSVLLGAASAALMIGTAAVIGGLLADLVARGGRTADLLGRLALLAGLLLLRAGLAWVSEYCARTTAGRVVGDLRRRAVVQIAALGPRWRSTRSGAGTSSVLGSGLDGLHDYLARYLPAVALAGLVPAAMVLYLLLLDVRTGLIVLLTLPLVPLFMALVGWYADRDTTRKWRLLARLSGHFADVVAGLPVLVVFGRAAAQAKSVRRVADQHRRASMATLRLAFLSSLVLELLATLSVALVAVTVGLRLVSGSVTLPVALTVLILAPEAYLPLRTLGARFHAAADGAAAVGTVLDLLQAPLPPAGTRTQLPARPSVRLLGAAVDFGAGRGLPPTDLTLPAGTVTVLLGPSGVGKSTVLSLVAGLLTPDAGVVQVRTGDGWTDLAEFDPARWREQVAWCGQRPVLLPGTIAQNLELAGPLDPDRLRQALTAVAAQDFLDRLPDGLDTRLGDDGAGLSAGQLHRLALARTLAGPAGLVLLDEPTADLDPATEDRVVAAIAGLLRGRTVLIATHRPALLPLADAVLTMAGRTAQPGVAALAVAR